MSLFVYGCATQPVSVEMPRPSDPRGHISVRPGRPGAVVAAPHATSDPGTEEIAAKIARRTGFGLVVATGFVLERASDGSHVRYQVNRPHEGRRGFATPAQDVWSPEARAIYEEYERRVREAARGPLAFYVEIHAEAPRPSNQIEIATTGIGREHALQLKTLLELTRDAHLRTNAEAPRLEIRIEPVDSVFYAAAGAKRDGILRRPERGLHIELPHAASFYRDLYTAILADFLAEAVALRALR